MLEWIRFILCAALIISGLTVMCLGVIGVYRFKYVLNRMHAAAMNDTMGIGLVMLGLIVMSGFTFTSLKLMLVILMLWLSSPVSSHLIGRLEITTNEDISKHMEVKL